MPYGKHGYLRLGHERDFDWKYFWGLMLSILGAVTSMVLGIPVVVWLVANSKVFNFLHWWYQYWKVN